MLQFRLIGMTQVNHAAVAAAQFDGAVDDLAAAVFDKTHYREGGNGLAGSRFAYQRKGLAGADGEGFIDYCRGSARVRSELHAEVFNLQYLASIIVLVNWLAQAERMRCGRVDPLRAFDIRTARRGRDVLRRSLFMGLKQSTCHELLPRHAENPCIRSAQYCRTQCALLSSYHSASFCRRLFQYAQRSADSLDY